MLYHIKGLKTFTGMEGGGYEFTLYDGKNKIAVVCDDATGGPVRFSWIDRMAREVFEGFIKQQYPDITFEADGEWANRQVNVRVEVDKLVKACSREILSIRGDTLYSMKRDRSKSLQVYAALLLQKHGGGNVTLVNVLSIDEKRDVLGKMINRDLDELEKENAQVH
jgi:hypothetical protein